MAKVVDIPGVGNVEFPDSMDDGAISTASAKLYQDSQPGPVSRFVKNAEPGANPVNVVKGIGESLLHPIETIKGYLKQNSDLADKATEAFKRGDHGQGLKHLGDLLLQVVPGLGAASDKGGEQIAKGDIAGGLGTSTGAALGAVEASMLPKVMRGTVEAAHAVPGAVQAVANSPGASALIEGIPEVGAGVGMVSHGNLYGIPIAARGAAQIIKGLSQRWGPGPAIRPPAVESPAESVVTAEAAPVAVPEPVAQPPVSTPVPASVQPEAAPVPPEASPAPVEVAPEPPYQPSTIQEKLTGLAPEAQRQIMAFRARNPRKSGQMQQPTPQAPAPEQVSSPVAGEGGRMRENAGEGGRRRENAGKIPPDATAADLNKFPAKQVADFLEKRMGKVGNSQESQISQESQPAPRIKGMTQATKDAKALSDKLVEWKFSPDEAQSMNLKGKAKLAHEAGVPLPSDATFKNAIFNLKKTLAGPERSASELIQAFKEAGKQ